MSEYRSRATIKDVAKFAGVSVATVSNVINGTGRVSQDTAERVQEAVLALNYTPSAVARSLKDKESQLIAVVVPFMERGRLQDNPFYWQLVSGIEESARNRSLQVILVGAEQTETFSFVHERRLDGLIVVGISDDSPLLPKIVSLRVPCVFMDSYLSDADAYQITIGDEEAGYVATRHLIDLGHRRIALLTGGIKRGGVNHYRYQGYIRALMEAGLEPDASLVIEHPVSPEGGYAASSQLVAIRPKVTAVFATSDASAIGLIRGLTEHGCRVPGDLSVVGFDDIQYASYTVPPLTTVRQDIHAKGQKAVELLMAQTENVPSRSGNTVVLPVSLIVRGSTAPIRKGGDL
ncbi:LacI family DNA-binding transcriptional regulator [Paenibacillus sp.]|uniref:LacI family DNA-binding transcriptional regulator n=1 Tax=Paenibacillus sp. TaxID=58172 RepID=UPI002D57042F|nr:LacI family DNA-binding transcriptional regulator [Paenibacillus sp.]HZG56704.1 LacI family DNA-binding transcriptional regulator [Paenibacillus sp.]